MKSRKLALLLSLFLIVSPCLARICAQTAKTAANGSSNATLILHVKNVRNTTGVVRFALFAYDTGWPEDKTKALRYGSLPANGATVTFTIAGLPQGTYGISVFHDENENHKLDRDFFGRPKEGIGFGNNPKIGFSPPSWKQSSVQVMGGAIETSVNLRYP